MKTKRLLVTISLIAFLAGFNSIVAQTHQLDLHASFENELVWCLNKTLTGSWTYHIAFHVNKKTGEVKNLHWNIKHCNLVDSYGNKYKAIDTGNDNVGWNWWFFNNINKANADAGSGIVFSEPDGWLDAFWPENMPEEGTFTGMFKFVGNGEVVTWSVNMQIHINAKGEPTVDFYKEVWDCN